MLNACDASLWLLAAYVVLHPVLAGLMAAYLAFRVVGGSAAPRRLGEVRILRLWADYAVATGLIAFAAAWALSVR